MKLGVLISGRGSNMEAIAKACQAADFPAEIAVVISNKPEAGGLATASSFGIPTHVVDHKKYDGKAAFEEAIHEVLAAHDVEIVCLAGFMRIISAGFISKWPDKILNIHPSLLPKYKGLDTHKRALESGERESGCTVHFVVPEMDAGPVILQKKVRIEAGDTEDSLAARILVQEHIAYPEAVRLVAGGRVKIANEKVEIS